MSLEKDLIRKEIKVLDKGFIKLIDYFGSDSRIVESARVSYGDGTRKVSDDRNLIRYLMRHRHTSPFEMCEVLFHVKLPIFVARQWIRHRTANVNEISGRYSILRSDFFVPQEVRAQSKSNKQGSEGNVDNKVAKNFYNASAKLNEQADLCYNEFVAEDVAREIARINLPLSTYTEWYWKIDLHNLFHFLKLRLDEHAQEEIRQYAYIIADIVKQLYPLSWEAFEDYILNAVTFSRLELAALERAIDRYSDDESFTEKEICEGMSKREIEEFKKKIRFV